MVAAVALPMPPQLTEVTAGRRLRFNMHEGQARAFWSDKRFVLVLAGTQGGKSSMGPPWLWRQIQKNGPGDYYVVAPTFQLMELKALPELLRLFRTTLRAGDYTGSPIRRFTFNKRGNRLAFGVDDPGVETHILFGYGADPDSLEASTAKGAWLDEAGQKDFKRESFEAILRRLSLAQGPVLLTTTPYNLGWLKTLLYDRRDDPAADIEVVNFPSIANPLFPREEFERARRELPRWKFRMFYLGLFERPAGQIYDCWSDDENIIPSAAIDPTWPRFLGLDFGGVNTAGVFVARELDATGKPTNRLVVYREYHAGGRTATQHATYLKAGEPKVPTAIGGSKSEGQWRQEFSRGGIGVHAPDQPDVEVGIGRVYGALQTRELVISDACPELIEEIRSYSRVLGPDGEPTEAIADKETFHRLDALRYVIGWLRRPGSRGGLA